jgi:hypothetical protein
MGLTFLLDKTYLLPLTILFLVATVAMLAYRANSRRGYGPFVAGLAAAILMLAGDVFVESDLCIYGGVAILVAASVWNAWPKRDRAASPR